ncbi:Glycolate dehydrogenase, iron-sulfur subunit GlcF, partial [hydrothermal vent metagenome]
FGPLIAKIPAMKPMAAMLKLAPSGFQKTPAIARPGVKPATGTRQFRVAILSGCAQSVLDPAINAATIELLTGFGVEVIVPENEVCCGSLVHHMGREDEAHAAAIHNINIWTNELEGAGLDAIIITASGCGTTIKDYGHMLRGSNNYAEKATAVSALAKDITEFLEMLNLPKVEQKQNLAVAYHSACSMQHGQQIKDLPKTLLQNAGFEVRDIPEGHLCCGSAGTYNIMQAEIADKLKARKISNIEKISPDIIATGNIGCITQIASGTNIQILHTVQLLNWAHGGKNPVKPRK